MPKRRQEDEEKRWLRKKKKYELKLEEKRQQRVKRRFIIYSDDESENEEIQARNDNEPNEHEVERQSDHQQPNPESARTIEATGATVPNNTADTTPPHEPGEADNTVTDDFDPNLLREIGDSELDPVEYGESLQADVAGTFQKILLSGIKKETKEELLKKYPFPKNVPLAKGPTLNPEIGAMLLETCKLRDKRLLGKQDQLGKALSAVGKALSALLKKSPDIPEVIRTLNDAGKLIADSHYAETDTRRSVIIPLIDKSLSEPFKDRKRDSFLFGEKLGDLVKDSRGIKKTGQLIQASTSTSGNLNTRGPSSRPARQQRSGPMHPPRAGGPRTAPTYQYPYPYNRAPARRAPPPPPPARRPPPPPPRRSQLAAPRGSR